MVLASLALLPVAHAHVTLQDRQASIDGGYKAVFKVPHGCKGSPTTKIHIRVPEGVVGVKPQPKSGWTLETVKGDYDKPHQQYGATLTSGVKEVIWSGDSLLDEHYDEFVFIGYLSRSLPADTTLYFPVVQTCEEGVERWIDVPSPGASAPDDHSDSPAPGLKLLPKQ